MPKELAEEIQARRGEIGALGELRQRVRHFTAGGALGGAAFVAAVFAEVKGRLGFQRERVPHPIPGAGGGLATLVQLRKSRGAEPWEMC
jgi:hypothetical protein